MLNYKVMKRVSNSHHNHIIVAEKGVNGYVIIKRAGSEDWVLGLLPFEEIDSPD